MGFGAFEKVALAYERPVWQVDGGPTHLTVVDDGPPEWPVILDQSAWYGRPVVVGLAIGVHARALAGRPEADRVAALHGVICAIGGPDTPEPIASATSSWASDPFTMGCDTSLATDGDLERHAADIATLAAPHGRVLFAGEHTNVSGTSTIPSAWSSGLREASRLLQVVELSL